MLFHKTNIITFFASGIITFFVAVASLLLINPYNSQNVANDFITQSKEIIIQNPSQINEEKNKETTKAQNKPTSGNKLSPSEFESLFSPNDVDKTIIDQPDSIPGLNTSKKETDNTFTSLKDMMVIDE